MKLLVLKGILANKMIMGISAGVIAVGGTGTYVAVEISDYNLAVDKVTVAKEQVNELNNALNQKINLVEKEDKLELIDKKLLNNVQDTVDSANEAIDDAPSWKKGALVAQMENIEPNVEKAEEYNKGVKIVQDINERISEFQSALDSDPFAEDLQSKYEELNSYITTKSKDLKKISNKELANVFSTYYPEKVENIAQELGNIASAKKAVDELKALAEADGTTNETFNTKLSEIQSVLGSVKNTSAQSALTNSLTTIKSSFDLKIAQLNASQESNTDSANNNSNTVVSSGTKSTDSSKTSSSSKSTGKAPNTSKNTAKNNATNNGATSNTSSNNSGGTPPSNESPSNNNSGETPSNESPGNNMTGKINSAAGKYGMTVTYNGDTYAVFKNGAYVAAVWESGVSVNIGPSLSADLVTDLAIAAGCPLDRPSLFNAISTALTSKTTETVSGVTIMGTFGIDMHW
ncbi:DNA repair protein RecN [Caldifermentibacillus hisashii]|mgnify:CR=1 FL=1|uniref:hypothetical protein n=1 Tax=Caldifermentibacillus hisashii TaxID=996558 RepID=UPI0022B9A5DA|nr:hypothetical protein [Caldifermentibacillus hisashii]